MSNHNFKIGDKVKLKSDYIHLFPQRTKVGKVIGFDGIFVLVAYSGVHYKDGFPYRPKEIEFTVRVGEQLLFDFMYKPN